MKYFHILLLVSIIGFTGNSPAQSADSKSSQIREEIEIMESILNKLFSKSEPSHLFHTRGAVGYYLDDFGILFKVPYDRQPVLIRNWLPGNDEENVIIMSKEMHRSDGHVEIKRFGQSAINDSTINAEIEKAKTKLTRFLGDYASAIRGLDNDKWLMVVIDFNSDYEWVETLSDDEDIRKLTAKVKMSDAFAYRQGKLSTEQLRNKIRFELQKEGVAVDDDIAVFADIIRSSLEKKHRRDLHIFDPVYGFYLDGYGAVFMLNTQMMSKKLHIFTNKTDRDGKGQSYEFESFIGKDDEPVDFEKNIKSLQDDMIDVMSRFGHTIRKLNTNEKIEIAISVDSQGIDQNESRIIMKLNRADLGWNRKKNIEDIQKRVRVIRY